RLRLRVSAEEEVPVAVASHEWVDSVLESLGTDLISRIDHDSHGERMRTWPRNLSERPVRRVFALRRLPLPGGDLHLLVSWSPGGNLPPAPAFDPLVRWILQDSWRGGDPPDDGSTVGE
ncbi:MAG TPA: hypothetical protein VGD74_12595, partial [Vulgatibacter sp.]